MHMAVDIEPEDMDLGGAEVEDLAADVDGNSEIDEEALDTDEEDIHRHLDIEIEESEGALIGYN